MNRLFITTKDRPAELTILCKSLLHSDMRNHIQEVIFLDDHSEDEESMHRIYTSFMYSLLPQGIKTRLLYAKDGRKGINQSWERIRHYPCDNIWMLNGDMMVFSNYFTRCSALLDYGERTYPNESVIVSGFNTPIHPVIHSLPGAGAVVAPSVGGCSEVVKWKHLELLLKCFGEQKSMDRGWDLHIGDIFNKILVTAPSVSQHIGIMTGLNQLHLSGFPGAWADINT